MSGRADALHVYVIDTGEERYWIASKGPQAAVAYWRKWGGYDCEVESVSELPDDRPLTVHLEDAEPGEPSVQTQTAGEWAAEGESFIGGTEW